MKDQPGEQMRIWLKFDSSSIRVVATWISIRKSPKKSSLEKVLKDQFRL